MYAECERYTGYLMYKAFVHLCTRGSIMANDVRREAIEDRLRRRERDKIEEREKPDTQSKFNRRLNRVNFKAPPYFQFGAGSYII